MDDNVVAWRAIQNISPPEPILISSVDPSATFISAYQTQAGAGIAIVYTVPVGSNYLYLTNYTLSGYCSVSGWTRLEIYDAVPALIGYIGMYTMYHHTGGGIPHCVIPAIQIPPTYSIRLQCNLAGVFGFATIQGKLSAYQY